MKIKRYIIILVALLGAIVCSASAIDNKTFKQYYNLKPSEFEKQLNDYIHHNASDSAMMCANIQANKYGKEKLTNEGNRACCLAFRYLGVEYLYNYYNYELAAENLLKAAKIADENNFNSLRTIIATDNAILIAIRNDLENNFASNRIVLNNFKIALQQTIDNPASDKREYRNIYREITASNLLYIAIKHGWTNEVSKEIKACRDAQKQYGISSNVAEIMCNAIDSYNDGDYDKTLEALKTPLIDSEQLKNKDLLQVQSTIKIAQYAVLIKSGKRTEALSLLLQHEQFLLEKGMTFEQLEVLQLIWQHYEKDGNKAMADKYALQYYIAKDEFINKSKVGKVDQAKLNLELEQTRERISEMSYRQRMQTIVLWGVVIIALLAFALLGMLYMNYRKTKRTNRLLYEKNIALLATNKELMPASAITAPDESPETDEKPANDEPTQADRDLMEKITALMESSQEIFSADFSRQRLADLVGSNSKYVSRAISACKRGNFYVLLNEYRIKEACRRLMDTENYGSYTIESIGNGVGFKSRSNFNTVFKDIVGLTPSAFQKMHREGNPPTA